MDCNSVSLIISAEKNTIYNSSIYSWELDMKYSHPESIVWMDIPVPEETTFAESTSSLQAAINAAEEGSIVLVGSGIYQENLSINKTLKIVSVGGHTMTHIFGEVSVTANGVILQGMTFFPSTQSFVALTINSSFVTILNCRFVENMESLTLYPSLPTVAIDCENCSQLHIVNNDFYGWKKAVLLKNARLHTIKSNTFRFCHTALLVDSAVEVRNNFFESNIIAIHSLHMLETDEFFNTNIFSANVLPFFGAEKFAFYQSGHHPHELISISNTFYVTGNCNMETQTNDKCASVASPKGENVEDSILLVFTVSVSYRSKT